MEKCFAIEKGNEEYREMSPVTSDFESGNYVAYRFTVIPENGFEISFAITNINVSSITMSFQNQQLEYSSDFFDFNLEDGEQIHNIILSSGEMQYEIISSLTAPITIIFGIPSGILDDEIFEITEFIQLNGNTVNGSIDVSGLEVDLTTDETQPFNRVPVTFEVIIDSDNPVTLTDSDYADVSFSFSNLTLDYLDGYFSNFYEVVFLL